MTDVKMSKVATAEFMGSLMATTDPSVCAGYLSSVARSPVHTTSEWPSLLGSYCSTDGQSAAAPVSVPRLWPGLTVVVIGGGSSLTPADVDYVRGKARVIAVKEAYQLAPWADVLYAADHKWWQFYKGAPDFSGLKFGIEQTETPAIDWPDVQVLQNTGDHGLELDPSGLRTGFNSGYQAINLAVHLGAARVVLLGFDCWRGPSGEQNWFGRHPNHVESPYALFLQAFATLSQPLKDAGVKVVNASRFTVLTAFPRVQLEEAFQ